MTDGKPSAEDINSEEILSIYQGVLPFLYDNPQGSDVSYELNKLILPFVNYHFGHFLAEDPQPKENDHERMSGFIQKSSHPQNTAGTMSMFLAPLNGSDPVSVFDEQVEYSRQWQLRMQRERFPERAEEFHYYKIITYEFPKVAVGFFRYKDKVNDNAFTKDEILILEKLKPHMFLLLRVIINQRYRSESFQYFEAYSRICTRVAQDHKLSDREAKFLPEILSGYSNEEIANRNFVSVLTVKKHIQHIFKKTGTKNRLDFIGKFFTSSERVKW